MSVSGLYNHADYYMKGSIDGHPIGPQLNKGARVKLRWAPVSWLDVQVAHFGLRDTSTGSLFQLNAHPSGIGSLVGLQAQPGYHGDVDAPAYHYIQSHVLYGTISTFFEPFNMKLLASRQRFASRGLYDFDGTTTPLVSFHAQSQPSHNDSAEFQILSNDTSGGAGWLQWIGGAYWFRGYQGFTPATLNVAEIDLAHGQIADIPVPQDVIDGLAAVLDPLGLGVPAGGFAFHAMVGTESFAGFAQATVHLTDWMALTLGGRYQSEKRNIKDSDVGTINTDGSITNLITWTQARDGDNNAYPLSDTTKKFKPKVSLDFRPFGDDTLLYVSWQQAFKSSTYNAVAIYLRPSFVKPEETTAWEIGAKTALFGGALRLNAAAFQYKISNLQTQFISLFQGGAVSFENAGRARVRGVDADFTLQVLPDVFDDLVLVGGAAYLDATYTKYDDGTGFDEGGFYSTGNDYSGNRIVRTPKVSGSLTVSKTWAAPGGTIELAADAYHNSGFYYAASNFEPSHQEAYDVFGARASYFYEGWGLRLTAFCKNLADEKYTAGTLQTDFGSLTTLAPPRTYGMRINWDF
jgi:iron complex outermembrane receptor protein